MVCCRKCSKLLPRTDFNKDCTQPSGRYPSCRACVRDARRASRERRKESDGQRCRVCGVLVTYPYTRCRTCALKDKRAAKAVKQRLAADERRAAQTKRCSSCGATRSFQEFPEQTSRLDGRTSACRTCISESQYRTNAKRRARASGDTKRYAWSLTRAQFRALLMSPCTFCGGEGGGVDRLDSTVGYSPANSVSCCGVCNAMKNATGVDDWIGQMQKILRHLGHAA